MTFKAGASKHIANKSGRNRFQLMSTVIPAGIAKLPQYTGGLKSTEMAEIVVAEATGRCPEIETQTY